jgi:addiction module HigA family antidote
MKNQFNPDYASPPGETLLELLNSYGMSQADLSRQLGRPRKTINEIIKGKIRITPQTALELESAFPEISARFWLHREMDYRLALAREEEPVKEVRPV